MRALALVGPTAVGKTELSIALARRLDGEIISMDSRQIYRGMDVGTAKVEPVARRAVPHHGLDLIGPDERYSAARFARDARRWLKEIEARDRLGLLVGGTGFFLRALIDPVFREPPLDEARRQRLRDWLAAQSSQELARWVDALDPRRSRVARAGGTQRLSRTLEMALLTGRPLSWWHQHAPAQADPIDVNVAVLTRPREDLYHRIDTRAEAMFSGGRLDEGSALLEQGYSEGDPGMTGTGYREAVAVLRGDLEVEEAVDQVQRATRGYARRQLTWFRNQLPESVLEVDATLPTAGQVAVVTTWYRGIGGRGKG
ncbi:MAG: tRNA (adenosine(37)-N6)-dimethylallyltransferase MiaA [Gemmatimonadota bacterium]